MFVFHVAAPVITEEDFEMAFEDISQLKSNSQAEVEDLFHKLESCRDQTQKQFDDILNCHSNISKTINNLVNDIINLQARLSVTENERDALIEIVNNFNSKQPSASLPRVFVEPNRTQYSIPVEQVPADFQNLQSKDMVTSAVADTNQDEENHVEFEKVTIMSENEEILYDDDHSKDSSADTLQVPDTNEVEQGDLSRSSNLKTEESQFQDKHTLERGNGLKCDQCPYVASSNKNLKRHMVSKHGDKIYKCELCSYSAALKDKLISHITYVHQKNFSCWECDESFSRNHMLQKHLEAVHKQEVMKFMCDHCSYTNCQKAMVNEHTRRVHEKIRKHACNKCDYASFGKAELDNHMLVIHKIVERGFKRLHECGKCPFVTTKKANLMRHTNGVHDNIKNYKCEECGNAFTQQGNLNHHMATVHKLGKKRV